MASNKELLYYYMQEVTNKEGEDFQGFTTQSLAQAMNMQRTNISTLLNMLVKEQKVEKILGKPVLYRLYAPKVVSSDTSCFDKLIGNKTTLKNAIQLAKAAILYPDEPMITLLVGAKGVGKSYFASLMGEYAKSQGVIDETAAYIKFDCSYYEDDENECIEHLFGKNEYDPDSAIQQAKNGVLFVDRIECLGAKAKTQLISLFEKRNRQMLIICSINQDTKHITQDSFISKFPMTIKLPSLDQRQKEERLQLILKFFTDEASKMNKDIRINSELMRCLLLYYCENNLKQLKNDIRIGCANAYVRIFKNNEKTLYVYLNDLPSYVRKGFLLYKDFRDEVEELVPNKISYTFTGSSVQRDKGLEIKRKSNNLYESIERKVIELRSRGVEEEDITTVISADVESEITRYTSQIEHTVNRESLSKIVDKEIINLVDDLLEKARNKFNRIYSSSMFSGLCILLSTIIREEKMSRPLSNDKIMEIVEDHKEEYTLCVQFGSLIEEKYNVKLSIDDIVLLTMFIIDNSESLNKTKKPVLLIAMHGNVASSIANVLSTLIKNNIVYYYDLLLDANLQESYDEFKNYCLQINNGGGILLLYDMGSIKTMVESVIAETGLNIKPVELPVTLIALDSLIRLSESANLEDTYEHLMKSSFFAQKDDKTVFERKNNESKLAVITLCMTGQGTALQMKRYLENSMMLTEDIDVIALAISDRKVLLKNINRIMENYTILSVVGTYDPRLHGLPFVSISSLFDTPVEKIPDLLALEHRVISNEIDYDQMYEYLSESLENVDINKLRKHLLPAVIKIKRLVNDNSLDLEVGLFMHIASCIGRIKNHEPMPVSIKRNSILNNNKKLYNDLKDILADLEKEMRIKFDDDELAILIEIVK